MCPFLSRIFWERGIWSFLELQQSLNLKSPEIFCLHRRGQVSRNVMNWSVYFLGHIIFE